MIRIVLFLLAFTSNAFATSIVAKVNDIPISRYDLENYMKLILVTSQINPTAAEIKKIETQVLDQLIEQRVKLQAMKDDDISIAPKDIEEAIKNIERQSGAPSGSLLELLKKQEIPKRLLEEKITSDIGWFRMLSYRFGSSIKVSDEDIEAEKKKIQQKYNKPHIFLYEIFIPVPSVLQDNNIYFKTLDIIKSIKDSGDFAGHARQYSKAATRDNGGEIGWIAINTLPPEIARGIAKVNIGEVSDPIRTVDGYYILMIKERSEQLPGANVPKMDRESIETILKASRLEQFSRKFLRDLMHKAVIEKTGL